MHPAARLGYVLPIRMTIEDDPGALAWYLRWLAARVALVVVVDGSESDAFARNARHLPPTVVHVPPSGPRTANGKVGAVLTGIRLVAAAAIDVCILADDDVRYDEAALAEMASALRGADLVRPQNYFAPLPWHALEDTGRTLLNRAFGADYPGTLGVRCAALAAGYAGDVLFENLELIRTVRARGGRELVAPGLCVRRLPPTAAQFAGQRVRQAYDSLAQPPRLIAELALLPAAVVLARRPTSLLAAAAAVILLAERGRWRAGGRASFPVTASLCAPVWVGERAVCSWLALACWLRGGVRYRGTRLSTAAHSMRELRRAAPAATRAGLVGAVAERLDGRSAAPAQGDCAAVAGDDGPVGFPDLEVAAQQERPVRAGGHDGGGIGAHKASLPTDRLRGTWLARRWLAGGGGRLTADLGRLIGCLGWLAGGAKRRGWRVTDFGGAKGGRVARNIAPPEAVSRHPLPDRATRTISRHRRRFSRHRKVHSPRAGDARRVGSTGISQPEET